VKFVCAERRENESERVFVIRLLGEHVEGCEESLISVYRVNFSSITVIKVIDYGIIRSISVLHKSP
jgi:hypothetical protein